MIPYKIRKTLAMTPLRNTISIEGKSIFFTKSPMLPQMIIEMMILNSEFKGIPP